MAFRIPQHHHHHHHLLVFITILCLTILFFFFLQYECYNSKTINDIHKQTSRLHRLHRPHPNLAMSRKVLASKFDFTPFVHRSQQHHQTNPSPEGHHTAPAASSDETSKEIDPRYGVDKRRVPTGPNPLHHRWALSQVKDEVQPKIKDNMNVN